MLIIAILRFSGNSITWVCRSFGNLSADYFFSFPSSFLSRKSSFSSHLGSPILHTLTLQRNDWFSTCVLITLWSLDSMVLSVYALYKRRSQFMSLFFFLQILTLLFVILQYLHVIVCFGVSVERLVWGTLLLLESSGKKNFFFLSHSKLKEDLVLVNASTSGIQIHHHLFTLSKRNKSALLRILIPFS